MTNKYQKMTIFSFVQGAQGNPEPVRILLKLYKMLARQSWSQVLYMIADSLIHIFFSQKSFFLKLASS